MSSRTKIVVLRMKELIYTAVFVSLAILLILLLVYMFAPSDSIETASSEDLYIPGIYTASMILGGNAVDIEVCVNETTISSISLVNLEETVATMYPLMEPTLEDLASQIYESQSLNGISYSDDNQYTSMVLLNTIQNALDKATIPEN